MATGEIDFTSRTPTSKRNKGRTHHAHHSDLHGCATREICRSDRTYGYHSKFKYLLPTKAHGHQSRRLEKPVAAVARGSFVNKQGNAQKAQII